MICHNSKSIFIHQRKCAGTSIITALGKTPQDPDWHFGNDGVLSPEFAARPGDYFVFAVVRNPWDRFVSGWKYCQSTCQRSLSEVLSDLPQSGHDYRHLTRPQHETLCLPDGRLCVDQILRFESLQQDFDQVCKRLGIPTRSLPKLNVGRRDDYRRYFSEEDRSLFWSLYGKDAELFGYGY